MEMHGEDESVTKTPPSKYRLMVGWLVELVHLVDQQKLDLRESVQPV